MKIGYARVSTEEQNLALQQQALRAADCKIIIEDQGISVLRSDVLAFQRRLENCKRMMSWLSGGWTASADRSRI